MNRAEVCDRFLDSLTFDLYPFQEEALLAWFEAEGGVLVAAPTGMGKTLIAEAAVFEALHTGQRLYYTTPLIALTDQKFREIQDRAEAWGFPRDAIGLITGNRRVNPDAKVCIVVAEILLNHLLAGDERLADLQAVVMDEFHYFNDFERGIVWELSLVLLPPQARLMLLSATVGNAVEFIMWLADPHGRRVRLVRSEERRVPLEFKWVGDKLLTEQLPAMLEGDDSEVCAPALVFCFNRDECWDVAEKIKGVTLIRPETRPQIEELLSDEDFADGVGPKLRQMLIRGVGVHHAGVLPKHKEKIEELFLKKLIPFVICTETLAAGINLPARSVVLSTLIKGKRGDKKLVAPSAAHQMFGRAGRPQFDTKGYVFAIAHEDDVKIEKWRKKYERIDPNSKDPGIMRARKQLEKKKPSRRKTEQYWTEGQLQVLIKAGPANLVSRSMIPYSVLIYLLRKTGTLADVRSFLSKRFNTAERLNKFQEQLDHMVSNLAAFGYVQRGEDGDHVTLRDTIDDLTAFRSVDPLYGAFCCKHLAHGNATEKMMVLESMLPVPPAIERQVGLPFDLPPGPLQLNVVEPRLIQLGIALAGEDGGVIEADEEEHEDYWEGPEEKRPMSLPDMLKAWFDASLASPEDVLVRPVWIAGGVFDLGCDFYKYVKARNLLKNEGLILRHLLRFAILAGEFHERSGQDPEYQALGEQATTACRSVDPRYTDRFLEAEAERRTVAPV